MKHFLFLAALLCIGFTACDDDDTDTGKLPSSAKIWINGVDWANKALTSEEGTEGTQRLMTVAEICRYDSISLIVGEGNTSICGYFYINPESEWDRIDTVNNRLSMSVGNIQKIADNPFFREDWHAYILDNHQGSPTCGDTIAYVPQSQRLGVVDTLTTLFEDKARNWDKIYKIFNDAFIFYPTTGAEYRKMLEEGVE
jgi:hypothetical protein